MSKPTLIGAICFAFFTSSFAQQQTFYTPGEIQQKLNKLNVLGTVLYVAAHPDERVADRKGLRDHHHSV